MAEEETTKTDIFKQQQKTIVLLQDVLRREAEGTATQPVFLAPPEPVKKPPNYLLYAGIAFAVILLLKK